MTVRSFALLLRIDSSSLIVAWSSCSSSRSFWPSSWVRRRSCMSRMKLAWISVNPNGFFMRPARAPSTSAALDELDDLVDHLEGLHEPLDDVLALLRPAEPV